MRRPRASLTAWPAFADFMTILAVVSLAIAAGVLTDGTGPRKIENLQAKNAKLEKENAELEQENVRLKADLADANRENADLRKRIKSLETLKHFGHMPCLPHPNSPTIPVPLLRIVVNSGYILTGVWDGRLESVVATIPGISAAIAHGRMDRQDFERYAGRIYRYGDDEDTFEGSCRFFVELKNETNSLASFARAFGVVSRYFLISNSSEVNTILSEPEGTRDRLDPR